MKEKSSFVIHPGPELDVKTLAARVRESAERRRAASPPEEAAGLLSAEKVLRSQADLNDAVAGSLRVVARHLQYAQEHFAAVEQSIRSEEEERVRADRLVCERLEQISTAMDAVNRRVETVVEKLAALERRLNDDTGD